MDFYTYWTLIGGATNFADRKEAAEKAWSLCSPDKQQAIIHWLQSHGRYPGRNPYFFILDFQVKPKLTLSYEAYYAKYRTTEERDGWRRVFMPKEQKTVYVK